MIQNQTDSKTLDTSDFSLLNGCILYDTYLPSEIVAIILSFVDEIALFEKCRFVCKLWNELIKTIVLKLKAERKHSETFKDLKLTNRLPWSIYNSIVWKNPFGKNLLGNAIKMV